MSRRTSPQSTFSRLLADRSGVSTLQYGVILGLVALGSISALKSVGGETKQDLGAVTSKVSANQVNADPFAGAPGAADGNVTPGTPTTNNPNMTSSGGAYEPAAMQSAPVNSTE